jgi:hypothetical protein
MHGRAPNKRSGHALGLTSSEHYLIAERNKFVALWMQADFDRHKMLKRIAHAEDAGRRPPKATKTALATLQIRIRDFETKLNLIQAAYLALVDPDGTKEKALQESAEDKQTRNRAIGMMMSPSRRPGY